MKTPIKFSAIALTDTSITAHIGSIHKRSETLQHDIHRVLCAITYKWIDCGDVRPAVTQINYLIGKDSLLGIRKNAICMWVEFYLGFILCDEGDNKGTFVAGKLKVKDLLVQELTNTRWFAFSPEPAYKPMDFDALLGALLDKASKRAEKAKDTDSVDAGMITHLRKAVAAYRVEKAVPLETLEDALEGL